MLSDPTWKDFLSVLSKEIPTAKQQGHLPKFLESVATEYKKSDRAIAFIPDLLSLRIKNLLSGWSKLMLF